MNVLAISINRRLTRSVLTRNISGIVTERYLHKTVVSRTNVLAKAECNAVHRSIGSTNSEAYEMDLCRNQQ